MSISTEPTESINKVEHMKFLIGRFDHYYDSANNKGSFYIGINTFILGGICVGFSSYCKNVQLGMCTCVVAIILLVTCFASIFYTLLAMTPFLKINFGSNTDDSLVFFGGITKYEEADFHLRFRNQLDNEIIEDYQNQIYTLSKGLNDKYKWLQEAGFFLIIEFMILIPLLSLLIYNLK